MIKINWKELAENNLTEKVLLLPTDTIYGLHALNSDQVAQDKIKKIKNKEEHKYFINLIANISDLKEFGIQVTKNQKKFLIKIWPGRVTIIFENKEGEKVSFRIPAHRKLRKFIKKVGPIISTSANLTGEPSIEQPSDLLKELQEQIDFYIDEGKLKSEPSTILRIIR